ncbi:MAG TPA: glycosyltransferase family 4 protein [Micromonosporaceae bacterium]|nr:glycosyltransferase family 4 protein [Micromonosporaceae bacterium]
MPAPRNCLIMVPAWVGQDTCEQLERKVAAGERPRVDYVELARALDGDVMDMQYMTERAAPLSRTIMERFGMVPAQVVEAFLKRKQYEHIVARADKLGLPLGLLFKLTRGRRDAVLISVWLSRWKKATFLSHLKAHSHLSAIINYGSVQRDIAADRLGVPPEKLHHFLHPVDERFWQPVADPAPPAQDYILSVGSEARDYPTLARALDGLDIVAEVAIGSSVVNASGDLDAMFGPLVRRTADADATGAFRLRQQLKHRELRELYAGARFVVVPLQDVDFDAGVTAITEAMAMGKAVIATRSRGQVDVVRDGQNGIYVPPGDPDALRAAIQRLLSNPEEAARMGQAGRRLVESRHTFDGWVQAVAGVVAPQSTIPRVQEAA